ncbi:MAG: carbohydrate kinase [Chloroflexota bacterium]|nr:carbohydrate kinase [Chloroflexota bacterium]
MKKLVVGIGELLWNLLPTGRELWGAPANFAYHVNSLGADGTVVSCVGADEDGKQIKKRMQELSLSCKYIATSQVHHTGTASVVYDSQGRPSYTIKERVAWDFIPKSSEITSLARKADAVCFGTLAQRAIASNATIRRFLENTSLKAQRILDINLYGHFYSRSLIEECLRYCNILKMNDEEFSVLRMLLDLHGTDIKVLKQLTSQYGICLIAVTRGKNGSFLYSEGKTSNHTGYQSSIVDTIGAGDSFAAALAMGTLRNQSLDAINDYANRIASYVCSQVGATPQLPTRIVSPIEHWEVDYV